MRVCIPFVVEAKFEGDTDFQPFLITDVSWGGLYLRMDQPKPIGTQIVLLIPAREGQGCVEVQGRVATQNKLVEGRTIPGVGISFDEIDHDTKSLIQSLVDRMMNSGKK